MPTRMVGVVDAAPVAGFAVAGDVSGTGAGLRVGAFVAAAFAAVVFFAGAFAAGAFVAGVFPATALAAVLPAAPEARFAGAFAAAVVDCAAFAAGLRDAIDDVSPYCERTIDFDTKQ